MSRVFAIVVVLVCVASASGCEPDYHCDFDLGDQSMFTLGGTGGDGYTVGTPVECHDWGVAVVVTGTGTWSAMADWCEPETDGGANTCSKETLETLMPAIVEGVRKTGAQVELWGKRECTADVNGILVRIDTWQYANAVSTAVGDVLRQFDSRDTVFITVGQSCPM